MTLLSALAPILQFVSAWDEEQARQTFVVGGIIRDALIDGSRAASQIGTRSLDVDLMTLGPATDLAISLAAQFGGEVREFVPFGTAKVSKIQTLKSISEIDVARCRGESYPHPGALPIVREGSLDDDVRRRDFTINTLLLPCDAVRKAGETVLTDPSTLRQVLVDRARGLDDLDAKQIRILHNRSFLDDPTRLFRAARYVSRIHGRLEESTGKAAEHALKEGCLRSVSVARQVKELELVLASCDAAQALGVLTKLGVVEALSFSFDAATALAAVHTLHTRKCGISPPDSQNGLVALAAGLSPGDRTKVLNSAGISNKRIQLLVVELQKIS